MHCQCENLIRYLVFIEDIDVEMSSQQSSKLSLSKSYSKVRGLRHSNSLGKIEICVYTNEDQQWAGTHLYFMEQKFWTRFPKEVKGIENIKLFHYVSSKSNM